MHKTLCAVWIFVLLCMNCLADDGHKHELTKVELGTVRFANSCMPTVKSDFNRSIALLHSFQYEAAGKSFAVVATKDPECAMTFWGIAMSNYHGLWDSGDYAAGSEAIHNAQAIAVSSKRITSQEKEFINALSEIYRSSDKDGAPARSLAYEKKMQKIHADYPNDVEVAIFYALALDVDAPKTDKTYVNQKRCGEILEPIFRKLPNHPGAAHYLIHCYDNPGLATRGLPAARAYAKIAPASAHAHHMPSHIFTRVGFWEDSIQSNKRSADLARHDEQTSSNGEARDQRLHALDYQEYAYLQMGRIKEATAVLEESQSLAPVKGVTMTAYYAAAAIPARYYLERGLWIEASRLKPDPNASPMAQGITWMAIGVGAARSGDLKLAQVAEQKLVGLRDRLIAEKDVYWSNQVEVQRFEVAGWIATEQGKKDAAVNLFTSAVASEESMVKHPVTPGNVIPAREFLAAALQRFGESKQALTAYEKLLAYSPNRFNAVLGAAQAADSANEPAIAARYYRSLIDIVKNGKERPQVETAIEYLQSHPNKSARK